MKYYSGTLENLFIHFRGIVSSFLIDWLLIYLIPGFFLSFIFALCIRTEFWQHHPNSPLLWGDMICIPWHGSKFPLMELHFTTNHLLCRPHLAKSPFIWYDFTFLIATSFPIVLLGLLLEEGDPPGWGYISVIKVIMLDWLNAEEVKQKWAFKWASKSEYVTKAIKVLNILPPSPTYLAQKKRLVTVGNLKGYYAYTILKISNKSPKS